MNPLAATLPNQLTMRQRGQYVKQATVLFDTSGRNIGRASTQMKRIAHTADCPIERSTPVTAIYPYRLPKPLARRVKHKRHKAIKIVDSRLIGSVINAESASRVTCSQFVKSEILHFRSLFSAFLSRR